MPVAEKEEVLLRVNPERSVRVLFPKGFRNPTRKEIEAVEARKNSSTPLAPSEPSKSR